MEREKWEWKGRSGNGKGEVGMKREKWEWEGRSGKGEGRDRG